MKAIAIRNTKKNIIILKKVILICIIVCLIVAMAFSSVIVANAEVVTITLMTVGGAILLVSMLTLVGITMCREQGEPVNVKAIWSNLTESLRQKINNIATIGIGLFAVGHSVWIEFTDWVHSYFESPEVGYNPAEAVAVERVSVPDYSPTPLQLVSSYPGFQNIPIIGTCLKFSTTSTVFSINDSYSYTYSCNQTRSSITINGPDGFSLSWLGLVTYNSTMGDVQFRKPIVFPDGHMEFWMSIYIGSTNYHYWCMNDSEPLTNWTITSPGAVYDGGTISCNSTNKTIIATKNGTDYVIANDFKNVGTWVQSLFDLNTSPATVEINSTYYPGTGVLAPDVPENGTISIPIPGTIDDAIAMPTAQVIADSDISIDDVDVGPDGGGGGELFKHKITNFGNYISGLWDWLPENYSNAIQSAVALLITIAITVITLKLIPSIW